MWRGNGRAKPPSPALVLSLIALFVSLGGTGYAAIKITGKDVADNSLTGADVKNESRHAQGREGPRYAGHSRCVAPSQGLQDRGAACRAERRDRRHWAGGREGRDRCDRASRTRLEVDHAPHARLDDLHGPRKHCSTPRAPVGRRRRRRRGQQLGRRWRRRPGRLCRGPRSGQPRCDLHRLGRGRRRWSAGRCFRPHSGREYDLRLGCQHALDRERRSIWRQHIELPEQWPTGRRRWEGKRDRTRARHARHSRRQRHGGTVRARLRRRQRGGRRRRRRARLPRQRWRQSGCRHFRHPVRKRQRRRGRDRLVRRLAAPGQPRLGAAASPKLGKAAPKSGLP